MGGSYPIGRGVGLGAGVARQERNVGSGGRGKANRRRGAVLVWTAVVLFVMILMVGLSIDWGKVAYNVHELQNAADAAALAGAQWVRIDQTIARDRAQGLGAENDTERRAVYLDRNELNDAVGDIVLGCYDRDLRTFTATLEGPDAVKVIARRAATTGDERRGPVSMIFGPIAGVHDVDITREAVALCTGFTGAGFIVLARTPEEYPNNVQDALTFSGDLILDVQDGAIHVNSNLSSVKFNSAPTFMACDGLSVGAVEGDIHFGSVDPEMLAFDIYYSRPPVQDPLGNLKSVEEMSNYTDPAVWPVRAYSGGDATLAPGYYPGGISISTGTVTFAPGIYVVDNGLKVTGGNVTAEGVMFYIASGSLDLGGNGILHFSGPGAEGITAPTDPLQASLWSYYEDVTIFQSRTNPDSPAKIVGGSSFNIGGILYFPKNHLSLSGTSSNPFRPGDQLICNTADLGGTGSLEIQYNGKDALMGFMSVLVHVE